MAESYEDKSRQAYSALGVGFVCLVIGLPLWWKTTEVYRVGLPYGEIDHLAAKQISYSVEAHIVIFSENSDDPNFLSEFKQNLNFNLAEHASDRELDVLYRWHVRLRTEEELKTAKSATNIYHLDDQLDRLRQTRENGNYTIYLLPSSPSYSEWTGPAVVGTKRAAFVRVGKDPTELASLVGYILKNIFVNEAVVTKAFQSTKNTIHMHADKGSMRSLRSSLGYDVTFTLMNPQPDMIHATWNIRDAIDDYLKPLLAAFTEYADIKMKSQYLHLTGLGVVARKETSCNCSLLTVKQLPHIINPIEPYLGSHVSNNPNLNFVVYVPTRDQSPLKIADSSGVVLPTNALLSPRWGGLMIYNIESNLDNATLPIPVDIDMKIVMSVFAPQLRILLGVQNLGNDDITILQPGKKIISDWELDLWLREHCIENIAKSTATLSSLTLLIDQIVNMVINDDIGKQVANAVAAIQKSEIYLSQSKLRDAFLLSRVALEASEKAFFDPSLLELLYFPEDQKFAIYIPLFLPVGIPIILSVLQAIKYLRNKSKEKKE